MGVDEVLFGELSSLTKLTNRLFYSTTLIFVVLFVVLFIVGLLNNFIDEILNHHILDIVSLINLLISYFLSIILLWVEELLVHLED